MIRWLSGLSDSMMIDELHEADGNKHRYKWVMGEKDFSFDSTEIQLERNIVNHVPGWKLRRTVNQERFSGTRCLGFVTRRKVLK